jgi:hypothetical protein
VPGNAREWPGPDQAVSVLLDDLARDRELVFAYLLTPPLAVGATAINSGRQHWCT